MNAKALYPKARKAKTNLERKMTSNIIVREINQCTINTTICSTVRQ